MTTTSTQNPRQKLIDTYIQRVKENKEAEFRIKQGKIKRFNIQSVLNTIQ